MKKLGAWIRKTFPKLFEYPESRECAEIYFTGISYQNGDREAYIKWPPHLKRGRKVVCMVRVPILRPERQLKDECHRMIIEIDQYKKETEILQEIMFTAASILDGQNEEFNTAQKTWFEFNQDKTKAKS